MGGEGCETALGRSRFGAEPLIERRGAPTGLPSARKAQEASVEQTLRVRRPTSAKKNKPEGDRGDPPKRMVPLWSPSVLVDGRLATEIGAVGVPATEPAVVGAVCTEATTPLGPNPGAHVTGPAGVTAVAVTVGVVTGITLPVVPVVPVSVIGGAAAATHDVVPPFTAAMSRP